MRFGFRGMTPAAGHRGTADPPGEAAQSQALLLVQGFSLPSGELEDRTKSRGQSGIPCWRVVPSVGIHRDQLGGTEPGGSALL
jgi:hypothetical protein